MQTIKDLKKKGRDSLRINEELKERIKKDHGSIPSYFDKCCQRDYKMSNGKIVKVRNAKTS